MGPLARDFTQRFVIPADAAARRSDNDHTMKGSMGSLDLAADNRAERALA
jgi:hypothetical protein